MSRQNIRDYELSIWTLQDSFITVLGTADVAHKGQLIEPKMKISTDGTQSLEFSIPIKYREGNELVDNPLWYNLVNGTIIVDLRKIKVIFNKQDAAKRRIFEFVINKVTEEHSGGQLIAKIEGEGLAFQELGHTGYKLAFSQEQFELEYSDWFEEYEAGNAGKDDEPIATIDYWATKVFDKTNWTYEVCMDWSGYDGITNNTLRTENDRQPNKIYEDEYVSSWETSSDEKTVVPTGWEKFTEKARIIDVEKSNRYNITQDIAEAFGVFCKYEYEYDDNYHIIGRKCVFYNNFFDEASGKIDINYPYDMSSVSREMDSSDLVTKMFVVPMDDDTQPSGEINIANEPANFSMEDYILNFEYPHLIGTISEEQYEFVTEFKTNMAIINRQLIPYSNRLNEIAIELTEQKQLQTTHHNAQIAAEERINEANAYINALVGKDETLHKTNSTPDSAIFLSSGDGSYYININQPGVLVNSNLKIYSKLIRGEVNSEISLAGTKFERDDCGNLVKITNFSAETIDYLDSNSKKCYLVYDYQPALQYKNILNTYNTVLAKEAKVEKDAIAQIERLELEQEAYEAQIKKLLADKEESIAYFERLMGPALKEGSWTPDDYKDYGNKYIEAGAFFNNTAASNHLQFIWDTELFEGEQKDYQEETATQARVYYDVIYFPNSISSSGHLSDLHFFYQNSNGADLSLIIDSTMFYGFYKNGEAIIPAIILSGGIKDFDKTRPCSLGYVQAVVNADGTTTNKREILTSAISFLTLGADKQLIYPRIKFNSEKLKVSEDNLSVTANGEKLQKYRNYSLTYRGLNPFINIKPSQLILQGLDTIYTVNFTLSNASLSLYLDALKVSQENAFPQVSYTVKVENSSSEFLSTDYSALGRLTNINDFDLHFENVQGYISEIELNLDRPWEDVLTIQNYKNKFEDLFQRIVASSEQMKTNASGYDRAASAITSSGGIVSSYLQNALNQVDLNYQFVNGTLTIDELNGIWARSDGGVVALRGGGLFTANQRNSLGDWIWNTAITPQGINASLIRTGQLNTDLIKIYAGDNVAFQMNGSGLYAYRRKDGVISSDEYVVHNGGGLFLVAENGVEYKDKEGITQTTTETINRVEISWDGLIVRNYLNDKVFYADTEGNLTLEGIISAKGGDIGGWTIENNQLSSEINGSVVDGDDQEKLFISAVGMNSEGKGIINNADGTHKTENAVFWVNTNETSQYFYVDNQGIVKGTSADFTNMVVENLTVGNVDLGDVVSSTKRIQVAALTGNRFEYENNFPVGPDYLQYRVVPSNITANRVMLYSPPTDDSISGYTVEYGLINEHDNTITWNIITAEQSNLIELANAEQLTFYIKRAIMELTTGYTVPLRFTAYEGIIAYSEISNVYRNIDNTAGALTCTIESTQGNTFKGDTYATTLICRVFNGVEEEDVEGTKYKYSWKKYDRNGLVDMTFNREGKNIVITSSDVVAKAVFNCEISLI